MTAQRPAARRIWVWVGGGCLVALLLCGGIVGGGLYYYAHKSCAPSDFPRYPGESIQSAQQSIFVSASECTMTVDEPAAADRVEAFYLNSLQKPPYELTDYDASAGTFEFTRALREPGQAHGQLTVEGHDQHSTVTIEITTP